MADLIVSHNHGAAYLGQADSSNTNLETFEVSFYDSDIDIIAPKQFLLKTVGTANVTLKYFVHGYGAARVEVYENPVIGSTGSEGTLKTSYNTNRNSSRSATLLVKEDPTLSGTGASDGTFLRTHLVALSSNPVELPGTFTLQLKHNTSYLVKVLSISDDNWLSFAFVWTEQ